MHVVVNGLLTNYVTEGRGKKTILLIHGWGDNLSTFDNLSSDLSGRYSITRLDLPGFGKTQAPADVWGLDEYATFVSAFLQKLEIDNVDTIVAHSNGAAVVIKGIASKSLTTKRIVILAGAGIRNKQKVKRFVTKSVAKIGRALVLWLPSGLKRELQKKLYGTIGSDMLVVPELKETFKKTVRQDVQKDAEKITLPTMLIYGKEDTATPPSYGVLFQNSIRNSELYIIENAGHFVHHDKPDDIKRLLERFIK